MFKSVKIFAAALIAGLGLTLAGVQPVQAAPAAAQVALSPSTGPAGSAVMVSGTGLQGLRVRHPHRGLGDVLLPDGIDGRVQHLDHHPMDRHRKGDCYREDLLAQGILRVHGDPAGAGASAG
ncbi:hypothetical protein J2809_002655 [Arthrobacter pascens]|uniref:hypothetical protein n=1 Tax=Arthrobacter pascens TaxID=1677 RepID=UPI002861AC34|nr:hypothetical protein [Arthrobacter pascens]MDR6558285.1 hypothetical protein [Arthrobacter pascens]